MSTTNGATTLDPIRVAIGRADHRYAARIGDEDANPTYLDQLAAAVRGVVGDTAEPSDVQALRAEAAAATGQRDQAVAEAARLRADLERALAALEEAERTAAQHRRETATLRGERDQHASVRRDLQARIDELTLDLANAKAAAAAESQDHRHVYELAEDGRVLPCACTHRYPRDVLAEQLADSGDDEPDREPIADLFARVRAELADWGGGR